MKVSSHVTSNNIKNTEQPIELRKGEVYSATIKERLPNNEAIVQIRGKEVQVKFEGSIPQKDRAAIQVTGSKDGIPHVKTVVVAANGQDSEPELNKIFRAVGADASPELRQMAKVLIDNGQPISKETIQHLKQFVDKSIGSFQQKLDTVQAISQKGLEITPRHLNAVHEALHGEPISDALAKLNREVNLNTEGPRYDQNQAGIKPKVSRMEVPRTETPRSQTPVLNTQYKEVAINETPKIDAVAVEKRNVELPKVEAKSDRSEIVKEVIRTIAQQLQNNPRLEQVIPTLKEHLLENKSIPTEVSAKLGKAINESQLLQQKGMTELAKQWLLQTLQQTENILIMNESQDKVPTQDIEGGNPSLATTRETLPITRVFAEVQATLISQSSIASVIDQVRAKILTHPDLPERLSKGLERRLDQIETLDRNNQVVRAKAELTQVLEEVETEVPLHKQVSNNLQELVSQIEQNRESSLHSLTPVISDLGLSTKQFIVTEITRKMSELALDFKQQKRDIVRNLDNIIQLVNHTKSNAFPQVKSLIESTIDKLDRAIMKNEVMLYSDMKTEKQLLVASSQLAEAKRSLVRGDHQYALKLLNEVKESLSKLNWQPADTKVKHLLTSEIVREIQQPTYHRQTTSNLQDITNHFLRPESSARSVYEAIRSIGLNHDSEVAQAITNRFDGVEQEQHQRNMKAAIMQLLKGEQELLPQQRSAVDQILNNLTGQQLLSKNDVGSNQQTMFINIPIQLSDQQRDLKLYINSKKEGEKVDWENCSLYFLIETKKLGDTGILISATDRNLAITIKNDTASLKERMGAIVERHKENLHGIGYNISGIQFTHLNTEKKLPSQEIEENTTPVLPTNMSKRGFDSKI